MLIKNSELEFTNEKAENIVLYARLALTGLVTQSFFSDVRGGIGSCGKDCVTSAQVVTI